MGSYKNTIVFVNCCTALAILFILTFEADYKLLILGFVDFGIYVNAAIPKSAIKF